MKNEIKELQKKIEAITDAFTEDVEDLSKELSNLSNRFDKLESEWPQVGDWYYNRGIDLQCVIFPKSKIMNDQVLELVKLDPGRTETEQQCIDYWEKLELKFKIIKMLDELNDGWVPDYSDENQGKYFYTRYDHKNKRGVFSRDCVTQANNYPTRSEEILNQIVDCFGHMNVAQALDLI